MLTEITDYIARARSRILTQYREKPNLVAIISEIADAVQALESALFDVVEQTAIGTAVGVWLDRLGSLVGEERASEGDVLFRRYILARVRANISEGALEDVIAVVHAWYGTPYPGLIVSDLGRCSFLVDLDSSDVDQGPVDRLVKLLRDTRAAGVNGQLLYQLQGSPKIFRFSSDASLQLDSQAGFGDSTNPSTGGAFRGVAQF